MPRINMGATAQYWARILGALALIKVASSLVKDAEKLIRSNMEQRNPELADDIVGPPIVEYEVPAVRDYSPNGHVETQTDIATEVDYATED